MVENDLFGSFLSLTFEFAFSLAFLVVICVSLLGIVDLDDGNGVQILMGGFSLWLGAFVCLSLRRVR